jgi:diguanylate cyclase (GGDEF)-like protein
MSDRLPENDPEFTLVAAMVWAPPAQAVTTLQALTARARSAGQDLLLACGLAALARARVVLGSEGDEAEQAANESLALFRRLGSRSGEACGLMAQGLVHSHRGRHAQALETLNLALDLARDSHWPDLPGSIGNLLGIVLNDMGRHAQAAAVLDEALGSRVAPSPPMAMRLHNNLALALSRQARSEREAGAGAEVWHPLASRAAQLAADCVQVCRSTFPWELGTPLESLASALVVLEELDAAHAALDEAQALTAQADDHYSQVFISSTRAGAWLQGGRPDAALQAADEGIAAAKRARVHVFLDDLYLQRSRALEALRRFEEALQAHKQFHAWRVRLVLDQAEERAHALAVTLDTERARQESRLDALTGLANRRAFDEGIARLLSRASATHVVALVLLDLDHFKQVNDRYGHPVGDEALQLLAGLLRAECRPGDLPARLGGDEFAVVLAATSTGAAPAFCQRLLARLGHACVQRWPQQGLRLTLSIGLAEASTPESCEQLMQRADAALYAVKRGGRDGFATG